jgi:hypothetical protein
MTVVALPSPLHLFNEESNVLAYLYYFITKHGFMLLKYPCVCPLITFDLTESHEIWYSITTHEAITPLQPYNFLLSLIPT